MRITYTVDMTERPQPEPEAPPTLLEAFREAHGRMPQVGDWYAYCCHLDLTQIESEETLQQLLSDLEDDDGIAPVGIWPTQERALMELP